MLQIMPEDEGQWEAVHRVHSTVPGARIKRRLLTLRGNAGAELGRHVRFSVDRQRRRVRIIAVNEKGLDTFLVTRKNGRSKCAVLSCGSVLRALGLPEYGTYDLPVTLTPGCVEIDFSHGEHD